MKPFMVFDEYSIKSVVDGYDNKSVVKAQTKDLSSFADLNHELITFFLNVSTTVLLNETRSQRSWFLYVQK